MCSKINVSLKTNVSHNQMCPIIKCVPKLNMSKIKYVTKSNEYQNKCLSKSKVSQKELCPKNVFQNKMHPKIKSVPKSNILPI